MPKLWGSDPSASKSVAPCVMAAHRASSHGTVVVTCPATTIDTTPAHAHTHLQLVSIAGFPITSTVGVPGVHGADVAGTHGCGVSTPCAAAVAAATRGFAGDVHMPKGWMLDIGAVLVTFRTGSRFTITVPGAAVSEPGAVPRVHISCAPVTTMGKDMSAVLS
jgi:hypothetical protein